MRDRIWLVITVLMVSMPLVFAVSCSRQVAKSDTGSIAQPTVQKDPSATAGQTTQPVKMPEQQQIQDGTAASEAARKAFVGENVLFAFDSSVLSAGAQELLNKKAEYLRANPDVAVNVEGHCDSRGTEAYNMALGARRADSVKKFLVDLGIGTDRLDAVSFGEERPIATGQDEASWASNRRVQFAIH